MIYTSGSTGQPKGSLITHANAVRLLAATQRWFGFGSDDVWTLFHSFAFDFSVWEIWGALAFGGRLVIVPRDVARSPEAFLDLLRRERVTVLNQTPSAFRQLAAAAEATEPDLSLRQVIFGGEALEPASLSPWFRRFGDERPRLVNMYGITETTVHVTFRPLAARDMDRPDRSPIGVPIPDLAAHAVDRWLEPVPYGVAGELAVGGAGLARGYLGRPGLTAERFVPDPHADVPGSRLYRSGDAARRLADGTGLVYGGRIDQQVKIRGYRVEPGEIEAALATHPGIREAVVTVREDTPGDRRLVAYVVPAPSPTLPRFAGEGATTPPIPTPRELREHLLARLPEHMVPAAFVPLEALPLTVNGKLDRKALPAPEWTGEPAEAFTAPRDPVEEVLAGIWSEVLKAPRVGIDDDFFALGGHSLLATQVTSRIRTALGVECPLAWIFERPTVRGLALLLAGRRQQDAGVAAPPIPRVPRSPESAPLPLSFAQQRLWFLDRLEPDSPWYNITSGLRLQGGLDVPRLRQSLTAIVERHESLRTAFPEVDGEPAQDVQPAPASFPLPVIDLAGLAGAVRERELGARIASEAARPFDLARGPVLRAGLLRLGAEDHVLAVAVHHIAADGWSIGVFVRELSALYTAALRGEAAPLPALPFQYADYAAWQRGWLAGERLEHLLAGWRNRLAGLPTALEMPTDRPRPHAPSYRGGGVTWQLGSDASAGLHRLARAEGATLFMVLLAAFQTLLFRYSGQEDFAVGSPIAGRGREELENLIGFFVNTLVLRSGLAGDPPFRQALARTREAALEAYTLQDLPFERLVEEIQPERDLARSPLFQAMFVLMNAPGGDLELPGLALASLPVEARTAKFELILTLSETPGGLAGSLEYDAELYDRATARRMLRHLEALLAGLTAVPERRASELPLLTAAERSQLLDEWNDTGRVIAAAPTAHALFELEADLAPDAGAVEHGAARLTYRELDERANRVAHRLFGAGLPLDSLVGVCVQRTLALPAAVLGILKAGGAYVPLDPTYPPDRLELMAEDARLRFVLADAAGLASLPAGLFEQGAEGMEVILLGADGELTQPPAGLRSDRLARPMAPGNLAYVLYTSGSTGRPKGVSLPHEAVVNFLSWEAREVRAERGRRTLQFTSLSFDVSFEEIFSTWGVGGTLVLVSEEVRRDSNALLPFLVEHRVERVFQPFVALQQLAEAAVAQGVFPAALRDVVTAGEQLQITPALAELFRQVPECRLTNEYGPTETHVTTSLVLTGDPAAWEVLPPIGRPIANHRVYLLDRLSPYSGEPVPPGVAGELCVGSFAIARGYFGRPDLTAERFGPDPFAPRPGARLYRTGDLARARHDGTFEFLGRADHQVKIRGHRVELGEIEAALAAHPAVAQATVVATGDSARRRLVAFVVPADVAEGAGATAGELRDHLRRQLPDPMVPAAFVSLPSLPLTPSGKVDRKALLARGDAADAAEAGEGAEAAGAGTAPRNPVEEILAEILAQVLRRGRVGIDDDFFALGGHSLLATQVVSRIHKLLGVMPPLRLLFERPTVRGLAARVQELQSEEAGTPLPPLRPAPRTGALPLSFAQQRLWFLDRLQPGKSAYTLAAALRLEGPLDAAALRRALGGVVRRHEALRTSFPEVAGQPVQAIAPEFAGEILAEADLSGLPEAEKRRELERRVAEEALRPFGLESGPVWRAALLRLGAEDHALVLAVHHIAADAWSIGLFLRELSVLYQAYLRGERPALPTLPVQYADYAVWQRGWLEGEALDRLVARGKALLAGAPAAVELPTDRPYPPVQTHRGRSAAARFDAGLLEGLRGLCRAEGSTLFMALLAGLQALLHRYGGQDVVVIGSPVAGRNREEVEGLIGVFINTLALPGDLSGEPAFRRLLARAREVSLEAFALQDLPFERLVEELQPERNLARPPVFQVMLALQNTRAEALDLPGLRLTPLGIPGDTAKLELLLSLTETPGGLAGALEYNADLFDPATAERLLEHLGSLLRAAVADPGQRISALPLLTAAERHQLQEWNDTGRVYPEDAASPCLHELIAAQAARTPDAVAAAFEGESLTYAELDRRAGELAARLHGLGCGWGSRVAVAMERSPELVVALYGTLKAGAAYVPVDPDYPRERLAWMLEDAAPAVLLAQEHLRERLPELAGPVLVPEDWAGGALSREAGEGRGGGTGAGDLPAYLIFTSGSTGRPKGAMVHHRAIRNRLLWMQEAYGLGPGDTVLQKTPFGFDVSVWEFFWPLMTGARLVLAKPGGHRDPAYLAGLIQEEAVTVLHFVPSLLQAFLEEPAAAGCESLRLVVASGEALGPEVARRFFERLPGAGLENLYGPTEAAVDVTRWSCRPDGDGRSVPIGRPIANTAIRLLERGGEPAPIGVPGELCIGGVNVGRGYFGRPDLTAERFVPDPFGEAGERLYRTGDLARFRTDGAVEFLGRLDFQVKIRGFRIELGEIEAALARHPAVREAAVAVVAGPQGPQLAAYLVSPEGTDAVAAGLRAFLQASLPDAMVPAFFVPLERLPLSPNGKLDRKALPAPGIPGTGAGTGEHAAPRTPAEEILAGIWAEVLRVPRAGIDDDFFALGGHSLLATQAVSRIRHLLGATVPLRSFFEHPTVRGMAAFVARLERGAPVEPLVRVPRTGEGLPLSFGQQRLWFLDRMQTGHAGSSAYNIPMAVRLLGALDAPALLASLREIVRRHEVLRTTFPAVAGRPVQLVSDEPKLEIVRADLSGLPAERREAEVVRLGKLEARRPFDLAAGPPVRATLVTVRGEKDGKDGKDGGQGEHAVFLTVHHIVADGWSLGVMFREIAALYRAFAQGERSPLPELPVQYGDFAVWQRRHLSGAVLAGQMEYWRGRLAGAPPYLDLPADRPRPPLQRFRGGSRAEILSPEATGRLRELGQAEGATQFMVLLAGLAALLHRYTGRDDLTVGTPIAGRTMLETEGLIGLFLNTLVLRADLSGDPGFRALLERTREAVLGAYAHQDLPFEKLVEELAPERDLSRSPLFQVMLMVQNLPAEPAELPGLTLAPVETEVATAKVDLTLAVVERGDRLALLADYDRDLFDGATVHRLLRHLDALLAAAAADPRQRLSELALLAPGEAAQVIAEWNDTAAAFPQACFHQLFAERARTAPDAVAVTFEGQRLTRGELDARSTALARELRRRGVGPETLVGIAMERCLEMMVAVLGVLKAGGAYVPLDPFYPAERLDGMIADSRIPILLTQSRVLPGLPPFGGEVLCLDEGWGSDIEAGGGALSREAGEGWGGGVPNLDNLAYVIYTSGSTGKPKGVQVPHRALTNFLWSMRRAPGLREDDVLLAVTSLSFDIAALELYLPLLTGTRVELASNAAAADGLLLLRRLREEGATALQATPSTWRMLLRAGWGEDAPLRLAMAGGEALPADLAAQIRARAGETWNLYGPTETAIWSAAFRVEQEDRPVVSIGRPIANTGLHVLDGGLRPLPAGVPGELYIGGTGVVRGYWERPDLTAERFLPDPFGASRGEPGARLYRTGDVARRLADGTSEFLGRADQQVKIRGFRIELGEIEAVLSAHPGIERAAVILQTVTAGPRLVAYVVPSADPAPTATELREHLRQRLPEPMVPALFVSLDALPLTPNRKIDRRALPLPQERTAAAPASGSYAGPRTRLEAAIAEAWQELLGVPRVGLADNFFDLGGHSLLLVEVQTRLMASLGRELTVVELFQYPTVESLAAYLDRGHHEDAGLEKARQRPGKVSAGGIAVIGLSGRFPGARNVAELWANVRDGVESIVPLSDEELLAAGVDPARLAAPDYVKAAAFLEGADLFDADFFGFSPREAEILDPQQRLFLEHAWQALEDAGYDPRQKRLAVGVYAGAQMSGYAFNLYSRPDLVDAMGPMAIQTGIDKDFLATRVSYKLGLKGPSLSVQTACSTSLVAVHLACQALALGECDLALAGGVAVRVPHKTGYTFVEGDIASPDGHCRAFDARARGTVSGSGVGVVVLKRLEDALRDGDTLHAVIKGTAINNDGDGKVGYTAPSVEGQAEVIAAAQAAAGVHPGSVTYVEAHGTGTTLGDPIEVAALTRAFRAQGANTGRTGYCAIGSLKTNLGHLDTAAGVAGLIKAVLALEHRQIPPSLHFEEPNPRIDFAASPFYVATRLADWPAPDGAPRRAGVSSFGIGGTNAHAVLEEAPEAAPSGPSRPWQLLVLSARTAAALEEATDNLARYLAGGLAEGAGGALSREAGEGWGGGALADIAFTLRVGRHAFDHRRVLVCQDAADATAALTARDPERVLTRHREPGRRPVVFLFPGQGAQHPGMARGLYDSEPVFRREIDRAAEILAPRLGRDLRQLLEGEELRETRFTQPALFAVEHALARLWQSWGVLPAAMIGHSVGEYVAACLAGVLSLEDALELVAARGELMQALPPGAMLSVELPEAELAAWTGREEETGLSLAAVNAPSLGVVSGPEEAVAALETRLREAGVSCRRLHTSHAFHSAMMEPALAAFRDRVARVALRPPSLPYVSNLTGDWIRPGQATDPDYWAEHLRRTVRFSDGVARLLAHDTGDPEVRPVLLEVGPGRTLAELVRRQPVRVPVHSSLGHPRHPEPDGAALLRALGRLWLEGAEIDWDGFHAGERRRRRPLPTYPFQRRRFWIDPATRPVPVQPAIPATDATGVTGVAGVAHPDETTQPVEAATPLALAAHPRPDLETPYLAPRDGAERRLAEIWQTLLGVGPIGAHDDFFELGGHSLLATRLLSRIRDAFRRELDLEAVFAAPTVARLAARIEATSADEAGGPPPLIRVPRDGGLPLSFAQQRLLFLDVLAPGDVSYNLPLSLRLDGPLHAAALGEAMRGLVERHEVLRTTFRVVRGEASQIVNPVASPWWSGMPVVDLGGLSNETVDAEARRVATLEAHQPFDLFRGPVARSLLVRLRPDSHVLLLTLHHVAADGWSWGIVFREIVELYRAAAEGRPSRLPELPFQYADFAAWQRGWLAGETLERHLAYWREKLAGLPSLELPGDHPRPPVRSGRGAAQPFGVEPELAEALRRLSRQQEATLFMTLLSSFLVLLHHYLGGIEDIVVGTDVANRTRGETEGIIGLFVNQLVLRTDLSGDPPFREVVARVRRVTLEAYAHQDAPFDKLVEVLNPVRDMSRTPLFQIKIVLQNTPQEAPAAATGLGGLGATFFGYAAESAKFDLLLNLFETGGVSGGITGNLEYSTDLFEAPTMARTASQLHRVLATVAERPDARLSDLRDVLAAEDREAEARRVQEHKSARGRTLERVRRKAIEVPSS